MLRLIACLITIAHIHRCHTSISDHRYGTTRLLAQPIPLSLDQFVHHHIQPTPSQLQAPRKLPFLELEAITSNSLPNTEFVYIADGRVLKQYLVMEEQPDDILNSPYRLFHHRLQPQERRQFSRPTFLPLRFPSDILTNELSPTNAVGRNNNVLSQHHGPVALGSGSLGYFRHANGAVYLGSGSLGYISHRQRTDDVLEARRRQSPAAGPLTFGDSPV